MGERKPDGYPTLPQKRKRVLRSAFNYDTQEASKEIDLRFDPEDTSVVQSELENTDINVIVARFGVTENMPMSRRPPSYGDYEGVNDFQTALNIVREAQEQFMELPSAVRNRFNNNPQLFLDFLEDSNNLDEMVKMGLVTSDNRDILREQQRVAKEKLNNGQNSTRKGAARSNASVRAPADDGDGDGEES